jgi:hypothetical protein
MPAFKSISEEVECLRGRSTHIKCHFSSGANHASHKSKLNNGSRVFMEEWFSGLANIEEEDGKHQICACGYVSDTDTKDASALFNNGSGVIPTYLHIPMNGLLVKGSTCQIIMACAQDQLPPSRIGRRIAKVQPNDRYSTIEIRGILETCKVLELNSKSPLFTQDWENESIEGWWLKEEGYCATIERVKPIDETICGYACNNGWWKNRKSDAAARDWDRWGFCEVSCCI